MYCSDERIFFQLQPYSRIIKVPVLKLQVLHATLSKLLQSEFGWGEVTVFYSLHKHLSQSVCSGFWKPLI